MLERVEPGRTSGPTKRGSAWGHLTAGGWRAVARRWWLVVAMLAFGGAIAALPAVLGGTASAHRQHPSSPVAQSVLGAANRITAGLCTLTGGQPGSVCTSPGVKAAA